MGPTRLGLRAWLEVQVNSGMYKGLHWINQSEGIFQMSWKHASGQDWNSEDASLFKQWAIHTGKFREGIDKPNYKTWKANFRCAANSVSDIKMLRGKGELKGTNATRIFKFSKNTKSRTNVYRKNFKKTAIEKEHEIKKTKTETKYLTRSKSIIQKKQDQEKSPKKERKSSSEEFENLTKDIKFKMPVEDKKYKLPVENEKYKTFTEKEEYKVLTESEKENSQMAGKKIFPLDSAVDCLSEFKVQSWNNDWLNKNTTANNANNYDRTLVNNNSLGINYNCCEDSYNSEIINCFDTQDLIFDFYMGTESSSSLQECLQEYSLQECVFHQMTDPLNYFDIESSESESFFINNIISDTDSLYRQIVPNNHSVGNQPNFNNSDIKKENDIIGSTDIFYI
ncbi:uncharacterized protein LOC100215166 isoform X1 [Hydra vulgaris]|uniref:uncharacterized protein LOC100215166 isoform X1 n=1 Tax=Hydra vulgaris TaxID=6087 RepID=UPI001F5E9F3D|nr:uncharacterized protein LOC100215166 [Hydra vulgaris]